MHTTKILRLAFVLIAALFLASCKTDSDGDWDPMVWNAETPGIQTTNGTYEVSNEGATLTFACQNYSNPWIDGAKEDDYYIMVSTENDRRWIDSKYFHAETDGNKLVVEFYPNNEPQIRNISITVTAGDIFYTFNFKQAAAE